MCCSGYLRSKRVMHQQQQQQQQELHDYKRDKKKYPNNEKHSQKAHKMPTSSLTDPNGTTPLPTTSAGSPVRVWFDADAAYHPHSQQQQVDAGGSSGMMTVDVQQPQTTVMASFEHTTRYDDCVNGTLVDINQHFCVYSTVKNGLIRILHRHGPIRSLLRGHSGQRVTDIRFFQNGGDVLGTVGHGSATGSATAGSSSTSSSSSLIVWRILESSPEIISEKLLEITTTHFIMYRIIWHPFNTNQFFILHTDMNRKIIATLIETTRIITNPHPTEQHARCQLFSKYCIMENAIVLQGLGDMTDLTWSTTSPDQIHVLTTHTSGEILLWDHRPYMKGGPNSGSSSSTQLIVPLVRIQESGPVTRCIFLPHENAMKTSTASTTTTSTTATTSNRTTCFVTGSENNSIWTLWSSFVMDTKILPIKLQVVGIQNPSSSYMMDVCYGPAPSNTSPPSCFLVVADRTVGKIFALHCRAIWSDQVITNARKQVLLDGFDYIVPFRTKFPSYSWSIVCQPTTDITDEELVDQGGVIFDMKLFVYQSEGAQCLTLTSYMCLPPEHTWLDPTPGIRVERLHPDVHSAHVSDIWSENNDPIQYDEDYDIGDDDPMLDNNHQPIVDTNGQYRGNNHDNDDDIEDLNFNAAPEASALPPPEGFGSPEMGSIPAPPSTMVSSPSNLAISNPFTNWLGSIATKTTMMMGSSTTSAAIKSDNINNSAASATMSPPVPSSSMTSDMSDFPIPPADPAIIPIDPAIIALNGPFPPSSIPPQNMNLQQQPTPPSPFLSPKDFLPPAIATSATAAISAPPTKKGGAPRSRDSTPTASNHSTKQQQGATSGGNAANNRKGRQKSRSPPPPTKVPPPGAAIPAGSGNTVTVLKREAGLVAPTISTIPGSVVSSPTTATTSTSDAAVVAGAGDLRMMIREEIQSAIAPSIQMAVREVIQESVLGPIDSSVQRLTQQGIKIDKETMHAALASGGLDEPIRASFVFAMRTLLIPAVESMTNQVLSKVSEQLEKGMETAASATAAAQAEAIASTAAKAAAAASAESNDASNQHLENISKQLATLTTLFSKLTGEVETLQVTVANSQRTTATSAPSGTPGAGAVPPPELDRTEALRQEILSLLKLRQYEAAFTKAVSASTADVTVFCCRHADLNEVLGSTAPALSQPILLCIMQQLGTVLVAAKNSDIQLELEWLQEIALSINPVDVNIQRHVPGVLQQLVGYVNKRMAEGEPGLRRSLFKLLQIIRGMGTN